MSIKNVVTTPFRAGFYSSWQQNLGFKNRAKLAGYQALDLLALPFKPNGQSLLNRRRSIIIRDFLWNHPSGRLYKADINPLTEEELALMKAHVHPEDQALLRSDKETPVHFGGREELTLLSVLADVLRNSPPKCALVLPGYGPLPFKVAELVTHSGRVFAIDSDPVTIAAQKSIRSLGGLDFIRRFIYQKSNLDHGLLSSELAESLNRPRALLNQRGTGSDRAIYFQHASLGTKEFGSMFPESLFDFGVIPFLFAMENGIVGEAAMKRALDQLYRAFANGAHILINPIFLEEEVGSANMEALEKFERAIEQHPGLSIVETGGDDLVSYAVLKVTK